MSGSADDTEPGAAAVVVGVELDRRRLEELVEEVTDLLLTLHDRDLADDTRGSRHACARDAASFGSSSTTVAAAPIGA